MKNLKPKERVIEAATKLFRKQGVNATGVNQIVKASKVAKASFYDHFKSKNSLVIECLNKRHVQWFKGLQDFIKEYDSNEEKIVQSFEYLKFMNQQEDFSGCMFLNMLSELKYDNLETYEIIKNHKIDLQNFFNEITTSEQTSFVVYMLFESCLTESQVYRSQEIINETIKHIKLRVL